MKKKFPGLLFAGLLFSLMFSAVPASAVVETPLPASSDRAQTIIAGSPASLTVELAENSGLPAAKISNASDCVRAGNVWLEVSYFGKRNDTNKTVYSGCIPHGGTGQAILGKAGLDLTFRTGYICTIGGFPSSCAPQFEGDYWHYFHAKPGESWIYSQFGANNRSPAPGTMEGWAYCNGGNFACKPNISPSKVSASAPSTPPKPAEPSQSSGPSQSNTTASGSTTRRSSGSGKTSKNPGSVQNSASSGKVSPSAAPSTSNSTTSPSPIESSLTEPAPDTTSTGPETGPEYGADDERKLVTDKVETDISKTSMPEVIKQEFDPVPVGIVCSLIGLGTLATVIYLRKRPTL